MKVLLVLALLTVSSYAQASLECTGGNENTIVAMTQTSSGGFAMKRTIVEPEGTRILHTFLKLGVVKNEQTKATYTGDAKTNGGIQSEAVQNYTLEVLAGGSAKLTLGSDSYALTCTSIDNR